MIGAVAVKDDGDGDCLHEDREVRREVDNLLRVDAVGYGSNQLGHLHYIPYRDALGRICLPDRSASGGILFGGFAVIGGLVWVFEAPIADPFTTDPTVISITSQFHPSVAFPFGFMGSMRPYTGSFRGRSER